MSGLLHNVRVLVALYDDDMEALPGGDDDPVPAWDDVMREFRAALEGATERPLDVDWHAVASELAPPTLAEWEAVVARHARRRRDPARSPDVKLATERPLDVEP
jgi:hypothetical protein